VAHPYPTHWEADVVLRDGATAHLRPILPEDADAVQRFHMAQSPESIYLRFFAPMPRLSDRDLHRFTEVDYHDRVAFVITLGEAIIGIGRYDRTSPTTAEVAFNISDAHQGRGVSSVLLEHLAAAARENGLHRFEAEVLPQNRKMLAVFREAGYEVQHHFEDGVISLGFDIDPTDRSRAVMEAREHRAESLSMHALLNPGSVVLLGASRREGTIGRRLLEVLASSAFTGSLHLVHPHADSVLGLPAHRRLADVPGPIDLAVVAVPAAAVLDVVDDCARAGVRGLLVVSGHFADAGAEGTALQRELAGRARAGGMRVVGPLSWGIVNDDPTVRLNTTLRAHQAAGGRYGLFCESGALSMAMLGQAGRRRVGVSTFLSAGLRADVSANDCLQYWEADPRTDAVGLYLESTGNPRKFSRIARRVSRTKPVVVLTSGTSGFGLPPQLQPAADGGPQAPREAFDALLAQAGCIRVRNLHQLFDVGQLLLDQPLPDGDRVAVVANSLALARLVADTCRTHQLSLAGDPVAVDEMAGAQEFGAALAGALAGDSVDAVVAVFAPTVSGDLGELVGVLDQAAGSARQPVVGCLLGSDLPEPTPEQEPVDGGRPVPIYPTPEEAVLALAQVVSYARWRRRDPGRRLDPPGRDQRAAEAMVEALLADHPGGLELSDQAAADLLRLYGIEVWPAIPVDDPQGAVRAAELLGWPVALKSTAAHLRHRLDLGGVRLDIADAEELTRDVEQMQAQLGALDAGLVVQRMAPVGAACVLSTVEDRQYGPVVSFGLGGDASALLGDLAHRIAPLTDHDVFDMVRSVRAAPKLAGQDVAAIEELLGRLSCLADDLEDVAQVELNPVVVSARGLAVLSASVRLATHPGRPDARRELGA
jgi:acyl-CoA synthetase (NDP forming)/RimJ/RimL family protein N-acetyltransferase